MEKSTKIGFGIFLIIILAGYTSIIGFGNKGISEETIREINIDAKRFEFSQPVIEINKGERIRIKVNNLDTTHGIFIPELNVNGNEIIEFTADKAGEFPYYCANMCGSGHHGMSGKIIIT